MIRRAMPDPVSRYFELDAVSDTEGIVALFAEDATVIDERETHQGATQIREWRLGPVSKYTYTTEVREIEAIDPGRFVATGRITGNFPGGSADLKWHFTVVDERITRLEIAPW